MVGVKLILLASILCPAVAMRADHTRKQGVGYYPLKENQYIQTWVNRAGSQLLRQARSGEHLVIPVACKRAGLWLKIDKADVEEDRFGITVHCVKVTCASTDEVQVSKLTDCGYDVYFNYWETKGIPARIVSGTDPHIMKPLQSGEWCVYWGGNRYEKCIYTGSPQDMSEDGLVTGVLPKADQGEYNTWSNNQHDCDSKLRDPRCKGCALPDNSKTIAKCQQKAEQLKDSCISTAEGLVGRTAWHWYNYEGVDWGDVEAKYPECKKWCAKVNCKESSIPAEDSRATPSRLGKHFHSWQYLCEKHLDNEALSSKRKCRVSTFCEDPKVRVCVGQLFLPDPVNNVH